MVKVFVCIYILLLLVKLFGQMPQEEEKPPKPIELRKKITKPFVIHMITRLSNEWCITYSEAAYRIITDFACQEQKRIDAKK